MSRMIPLSFEFYPPKTDEQRAQLDRTARALKSRKPEYVSCTFGDGGSTLTYTPETIQRLRQHHGYEGAPHISCMGGTRAEISALLAQYRDMGCTRIVALRGDLPSGMGGAGDFRYASELIEFIRAETGGHFRIEVACYPEMHPQAEDMSADLVNLKRKVEAGANGAITQYFYNADGYFRLRDDATRMGVDVPIVPGVMPISNYTLLKRFSDACGAEIPRWIAKRMSAYGDDVEAVRAFGADVVSDLCRRLIAGGAPGLHVYTLNLSKPTLAVLDRLA
jgi:methylenetetrahydrofolate reductase (NADPH)